MIDFIQSESKKLMYKCCEKYAAEKGLEVENVQLILGLNELGNTYLMCENFKPKESYTFLQVLGVKIDFLGYSNLAPPFIMKALVRFSGKYSVDMDKIQVMCVPFKNERGKNDMELFLYNQAEYIETIEFSDLFSEEDAQMPTI